MTDSAGMDEPSLRVTVTGGAAWSLIGQLVTQGTRVVLLVVLARLLDPEQFGLVGMIAVFTGSAAIFVDAGFSAALVQRTNVTSQHIASAFWVSSGSGLALAVLLVAASPLIARLYGEPILIPLVIASAPTFVFSGIAATPRALLQRAMNFRKLALVQIVSVAIGGATGIGLAAIGAGVWSLVAMTVTLSATNAVGFWRSCDHPIVARFDRTSSAELWRFGRNLMGFGVMNYWARQADDLLIGWRIGAEALGLYTRAYSLMLFPITQVSSILGAVMFPAMSRIQHELSRVRSAYLSAVSQIAALAFPAMVGMTSVAHDFVYVVFGPGWLAMVPILQILGLVGAVQSVSSTVGWLYLALDETRAMFRWGVAFSALAVASFVVGIRYGVIGVAVAYGIANLLATPVSVHVAGRKAGVTAGAFARAVAPAALATAIMVGALLLVERVTMPFTQAGSLAVDLSVGAASYTVAALVVMPRTLRSTLHTVRGVARELLSPHPPR